MAGARSDLQVRRPRLIKRGNKFARESSNVALVPDAISAEACEGHVETELAWMTFNY